MELLQGKVLKEIRITDHMALQEMDTDPNAIWSLLLFSGYLTGASYTREAGNNFANLIVPNTELYHLFQQLVEQMFKLREKKKLTSLLKNVLTEPYSRSF